MTSVTSLLVGLFSILGLKQLQVVGVTESLHDGAYQSFSWRTLEVMSMFSDMTKPEQELLAKYLLQQLISRDPDPELDPVLARLARADLAAGDLASEQSQTIATIVPAPPGLESGPEPRSGDSDQCESDYKFIGLRGFVNMRYKEGSRETTPRAPTHDKQLPIDGMFIVARVHCEQC